MNPVLPTELPQTNPQPGGFVQPLFCPRCHAEIRESDNYCHACGRSLKPGRGFLFTHAGIILMALVLGPLALPFVWMSKVISLTAKIIYTLLLLLVGFYLVVTLWTAFSMISNSLQMMTGGLEGLGNLNNLGGL